MSANVITVSLSVEENPDGTGNTRNGDYSYKFIPEDIHVTEKKTEVVYRLVERDRPHFEITGLYSTDTKDQFVDVAVIEGGAAVRFVHENSRQQLTVVSVRVRDRKKMVPVACDPQVTNDPPPVGIGP